MNPRHRVRARLVEVGDRQREVILVRRPIVGRGRTLVDEDLGVSGREDRTAGPVGDGRGLEEIR